MIVYNITSKIDPSILPEWLRWMREQYIPEVLGTQYFDDHKMYRLLDQPDDDGATYVVQYITGTRQRYQEYIDGPAREINRQAYERWGDGYLAYHTHMELVQ